MAAKMKFSRRSRKTRKTTAIYLIKAGKYYYIGKSNNPWRRLEAHKKKAREDEGNNKKKNRIFRKHLHDLSMRILEKPKMSKWRDREIYYIAYYRKRYGREMILNMTEGGDGSSGGGYRDKGNKAQSSPLTTMVILIALFFSCGCLYYFG